MSQPYVATATVARRAGSLDEAGLLQDIEMVGQEVRGKAVAIGELDRRAVRHRKIINEGETCGIPEGGMESGTKIKVHAEKSITQRTLSQ